MPTVAPHVLNSYRVVDRLLLTDAETLVTDYARPFGIHEIFVPSDLGGRLRVGFGKKDGEDKERRLVLTASNGQRAELDPDSGAHEVRLDFAPGARGSGACVAVVRAPAGKYSLYAVFDEEGFARERQDMPLIPWNFWYFPFAASLHEDSALGSPFVRPLAKYEDAFGVAGVEAWEREHHGDPHGTRQSWEGHCDNAAAASVLFERPPTAGLRHAGVDITCEELKFYATEFFGSFGLTKMVWRLPGTGPAQRGGPPQVQKPSDDSKAFGGDGALGGLLTALSFIRDDGEALVMDLRDEEGEDDVAVWNHAVYRYVTRYSQQLKDLFVVEGRTTLYANADIESEEGRSTGVPAVAKLVDDRMRPVKTGKGREVVLRYRVRFRFSGKISTKAADNLWYSCRTVPTDRREQPAFIHAPRWALRVLAPLDFRKPGADGNPLIQRAHVLDVLPLRKGFR